MAITYVPRAFGSTVALTTTPQLSLTVTWVTRDGRAAWVTRDEHGNWQTRDEQAAWDARDEQAAWKTRA